MKFANATGEAQKTRPDAYTYKEGRNRLRLVGELLPRYVYWLKGENNKPIPMECLAFDREQEKFLNAEKDWVKEFHPDLKCGWAYVMQGFDLDNPDKPLLINLKKKLTGQILELAAELGDPTDPDTGWDVIFDKKKTGPLPINVEYKLKEREIKPSPLSDELRAMVAEMKSMDEIMPRPTPEQQKEFLERLRNGSGAAENIDESVSEEFEVKE